MPKTAISVGVVVAIGIAIYFAIFVNSAEAPIIDPTCEPGYELVGEGCIPASEACELRGDQYYFDESKQECLMR